MHLNVYQKFQLVLAAILVGLFLDLWITLQTGNQLPPELSSMFSVLWGIILLLADPKELAALITGKALPNPALQSPVTDPESGFINLPLLLGLALLCLIMSGCATDTPLQTAGKSLLAVKESIITSAQTADTLCKSGVLDQGKCAKAKIIYEQSKPAYDATVDAYLLLSHGENTADFSAALYRVQNIAADLLLITNTGGAK